MNKQEFYKNIEFKREVGIDLKVRKQVASNIAITHHPCSIHCILHVSAQV